MGGKRDQWLEGGGLRVRFHLREDRYAHEIWIADGAGAWRRAVESVEGSPFDTWPVSPPLQSISVEDRSNGGCCALLVGMAGGNHYSASVEFDQDHAGMRFELACRTRGGTSGRLGSCYRTLGPSFGERVATAVVAVDTAGPAELVISAGNELGASRLEISGAALNIVPFDVPVRPEANTIRWGYTLTRRRTASDRGVFQ